MYWIPFRNARKLAKVHRVVDGDTLHVWVEINKLLRIRVLGVDCPETRRAVYQTEKHAGLRVKEIVAQRLTGRFVLVHIKDQDNFGRYLAHVRFGCCFATHMRDWLIEQGLAMERGDKQKKPYFTHSFCRRILNRQDDR